LALPDAQTRELVSLCVALGAIDVGGRLSTAEATLVASAPPSEADIASVREEILGGGDPLGERILAMRSAVERRSIGQVFTPKAIVEEMVDWVAGEGVARVVDCGCGSGRFALAAASHAGDGGIVAVDLDPLSTLACRANAAVLEVDCIEVRNADFIEMRLPAIEGRTAFIGNPPYVRHHHVSPDLKSWARRTARDLGWADWSGLAGLHALFFMSIVEKSEQGDIGCLLTSSEWLDVNYGRAMRGALLDGAGGRSVHVLKPESRAFDDAMTTASIMCFERGLHGSSMRLQSAKRIQDLSDLGRRGRLVSRMRLEAAATWTELITPTKVIAADCELVPLGELVRVSRGAVTGGNDLFLLPATRAEALGIAEFFVPAITRAREVQVSGGVMSSAAVERHMLKATAADLERSLRLRRYLGATGARVVQAGHVCSARKEWYSVPLKTPPVVATYMGRGRPAFALNSELMPTVNVVHGLYPKASLDEQQLRGLVNFLNANELRGSNGRVYQGGLRKFEPKEMERLLVPVADELRSWASHEP